MRVCLLDDNRNYFVWRMDTSAVKCLHGRDKRMMMMTADVTMVVQTSGAQMGSGKDIHIIHIDARTENDE